MTGFSIYSYGFYIAIPIVEGLGHHLGHDLGNGLGDGLGYGPDRIRLQVRSYDFDIYVVRNIYGFLIVGSEESVSML